MSLDQTTLETDTPRTLDGRAYPAHLRGYERLDHEMLALLADGRPHTVNELSIHIPDIRSRAALPHWLASARWRDLIDRAPNGRQGPVQFLLTVRGRERL